MHSFGQVGFRLSHHLRSRWNLASELRVFAGQNFQTLNNVVDTTITQYDGVGISTGVDAIRHTSARGNSQFQEFVFGVATALAGGAEET